MTFPGSMKIGCVIALALAFNQRLCAQLVEATTTGPIVQTRPDDGSPITATTGENIGYSLLRKLRSSVSIVTGYDDNVNTSGVAPAGSLYTNANASLSYSFGSPRTRVSLAGGGGISYYLDRPGESNDDFNAYFALSLMHKFTKRLTLNLNALASYQSQPDFSTNLGSNQMLGNFFRLTSTDSLALLWGPRFSTVTSYTLGVLKYDSGLGSLQNRLEQTFGQEARFLLFPSTTIDVQYRFEIINYENNAPQDSTTHFFLAGFDHRFTSHLNTSFHGGVEIRSSENNGNGATPYFDSSLTYAFGRRISVSWTNSYSVEESDAPGGSSGPTFRTELFSQIGLTRRLSASLALNYILGGSSIGNTIDIAPSVSLMITRSLFVNAGYHFTNVNSDQSFSSYSRNNYFAGLNFSF